MSKSGLTFNALEQISVIAVTLRTAAGKADTQLLASLVLALTPRLIELTDLLTYVALDDPDSVENLRLAVFGPDSDGSAS